jgi:hypothetical protein
MNVRTLFGFLLIASLLAFVYVPTSRGDDDCQKRIIKADHNLHEEAAKHGWDSPQAEHWRQELASARAWCWDHGHRWWDEDAHTWHDKRDWDDHDHDHDHH